MPPKRILTTRLLKRQQRKITRKQRNSNVPRAPGGLPGFLMADLNYYQYINIDPSAAIANNTFNCNSLYDPDQSGTGHQPSGYDQISAMYSRYVVLSSTLTAWFYPQGGGANIPYAGGCNLYDGSSPYPSGAIGMLEQSNGVHLHFSKNSSTYIKIPKVIQTFSAQKWFGLTDVSDNRESVGALTNASPTRRAYFQLWAGPIDESTDVDAIYVLVHIRYHAQFYAPLQVGAS